MALMFNNNKYVIFKNEKLFCLPESLNFIFSAEIQENTKQTNIKQ